MVWEIVVGAVVALVVAWLAFLLFVFLARPPGWALSDTARIAPDLVRLLRRLASDRSLARPVRTRVLLLLGYLALPIDLVPDFVPVIGYADDAIITMVVLRSVVRRAGPDAVRRHWPGTDAGLAALWRLARLPGMPSPTEDA